MYSQIHGIYFSHTAILSRSSPAFPKSTTADTPTDDEILPLSQSDLRLRRKALAFVERFSAMRPAMKKREYDVFLSFRGEDTSNTFTGHLDTALIGAGINAFINDEELPRGEPVSNELRRAIEGSAISVVVLSGNYVDSAWGLEVLCKIVECRRTPERIVIPIFYGVDPWEIRKQTGKVAAALLNVEERLFWSGSDINESKKKVKGLKWHQEVKLERWKLALTEVANCSGWESNFIRNEAELIKAIVDDVLRKTPSTTNLHVALYPVGIYSCAQELRSLKLKLDYHKVRVVGICGMAGVGKTTVVKVIITCSFSI